MPIELSIRQLVFRLVLYFTVSLLFGLFIGHVYIVLLFSALALLAYQYYFRIKLIQWIWHSKAISPPHADGTWGRIFDGLDKLIRGYRKKQKILTKRIGYYRDGAEALPDAAIVLGQDSTIQWSNKKAGRLLGIRWPGDSGQRIENLLRAPEFSEYLHKADFSEPCVIASPINAEQRLEMRFMHYGKEQVLLLVRDISRIHRIEEMRRDFVANVSHELKTPLTVVRGYVEMIQSTEHALEPHWQQAFGAIETQVSRMDRLVEQLLILSRVEAATDDEGMLSINMADMIANLTSDATWLNQDKQHNITVNTEYDLGIIGVETEIKSACANLISNAIAYTPIGGDITISWRRNDNKAVFSVQDNGPGIRPEDINRLTERFYRVDKSRSRNTGGSGLGLAIVKHVLHHHGAELVINSRWQHGSTFSIVFEEHSLVHV